MQTGNLENLGHYLLALSVTYNRTNIGTFTRVFQL